MSIMPSIPDDLVPEILSTLPAKCLVRLECASLAWRSLIRSTRFMEIHLARLKDAELSHLLFLGNLRKNKSSLGRFFLQSLGSGFKFNTISEVTVPDNSSEILCSCDGLVLLQGRLKSHFILWSPSTRRSTSVYCVFCFYHFPRSWGLCHDRNVEDCKIVLVDYGRYLVYSCKNQKWTSGDDYPVGIDDGAGVCVGGALYWAWLRKDGDKKIRRVLYFDSRDDKFKKMETPTELNKTWMFSLISLRDRLCMGVYVPHRSEVCVWMKAAGRDANEWSRFMMINGIPRPLPRGLFEPLYFGENLVVMRLEDGVTFLVYFPMWKLFRAFLKLTVRDFIWIPHIESILFFPTRATALPLRKRKPSIIDD